MKIRFGPFTLDRDARRLACGRREIHLSRKGFELLETLVLDRPEVLSKAELQQRLWPDAFVAEADLSNLVAEVRDALGDKARAAIFIRTARGVGYAFCGDAAPVPYAADVRPDEPLCWLEWGRRRFPLSAGEHIVGRDRDAAVKFDASTVSRRHARFVVTTEGTVIEDLSSKNGTFRGGERITSPVLLIDGDAIRIGSLLVIYHARARVVSTDTHVEALS